MVTWRNAQSMSESAVHIAQTARSTDTYPDWIYAQRDEMPAYKSQHYLPQMYMRLFSADGMRVGVLVIGSGKFIPHAPINGQGCRDYFYGKDPRSEKAFCKIEARAAEIFADAVEHHRLPLP